MTTTKKTATTTKTRSKTTAPKTVKTVAIPDLPRNPLAFEVLDVVSKQRTKAKKVEALKKYEDVSLKMLFIWNFDESVISLLPPGEVPYANFDDQVSNSGSMNAKMSDEIRRMHETGSFSIGNADRQGRTTIRRECKNFYHFIKGGNDGLTNLRRETMFINLLQGLHPLEAEILCLVKDKKLSDTYNLTKEIVAEAYPDIQWGNRS
jgi:hypothetical protein